MATNDNFLAKLFGGGNKPVAESIVVQEEDEDPIVVPERRASYISGPLGPSEDGPAIVNVDVVEHTALERLLALWYVLAACIGASLILSATGDLDSAFDSFEYTAAQDNTTAAQVRSSRRTDCTPLGFPTTRLLPSSPQTVASSRLLHAPITHAPTPVGPAPAAIIIIARRPPPRR